MALLQRWMAALYAPDDALGSRLRKPTRALWVARPLELLMKPIAEWLVLAVFAAAQEDFFLGFNLKGNR